MKKVVLHPEIILIQDFLSKEMCDHFIEKGEQVSFEEAKVSIDGKQIKMKGLRNNQRILFKDQLLANQLWKKIESHVVSSFGKYKASGLNEMFRIYKYEQEQRFKMHRDGSYERNEKECSFFSFLIYLNQEFEGGETHFENGITIYPECGDALIFHHPLRHEGRPILSGKKYVLRSDIMYKLEE